MNARERMTKAENPFEVLADQLFEIKSILDEIQKQQSGTRPIPETNTDYISVTEAAQFLGVSKGSIYRYVMTGTLQKKKFGNKLYFSKQSLTNLIEKGMK